MSSVRTRALPVRLRAGGRFGTALMSRSDVKAVPRPCDGQNRQLMRGGRA